MLNYAHSNLTGRELGLAATAAGFDGVQIYVSPYCNNADCKRTTGKYAVGIAAIVTAFRAAAPAIAGLPQAENIWWYLETRQFGSCPHAGFGLGFERLYHLSD